MTCWQMAAACALALAVAPVLWLAWLQEQADEAYERAAEDLIRWAVPEARAAWD